MLSLFFAVISLALGGGAGWLLGRGVPQLVQRSTSLARGNRTSQLFFAAALLVPWAVGLVGLVLLLGRFDLLLWVLGYWGGFLAGRRKLGL
jgi:membrane protein YqaA with SNARE-associated domain